MIKILLKHKIFEYAIETFFTNMLKNFSVNQKPQEYAIGDTYGCLITSYMISETTIRMKWFYGVTVIGIPGDGYITIGASELNQSEFDIQDETLDDGYNIFNEINRTETTEYDVRLIIDLSTVVTVYNLDNTND